MITPHYYYYRHGKSSDLSWIKSMLRLIPESEHQTICDKYVKIYAGTKEGDRRGANSYLKSRAAEYRAKNAS